ncbi:MAG TPA: 5-(carboxyamino)imidazole ribonucleotide mutase [Burkholderiales bacterium]|nr:5-(carboxyamino)imidazole ribonucleotide mutase [Burkholderiales bacterium]
MMATNKTSKRKAAPTVAILMGSANDWDVMQHGAKQLKDFGVSYEARALSAHRTPELLAEFVNECIDGGTKCFIAGAGGAAHLAGVIAALTTLPVLAVPIPSKHLGGLDSLLSMVQMPKGIPVATFAIGDAGSANAGLFAVAMLAMTDQKLATKLQAFRAKQVEAVKAAKLPDLP